MSVSRLNDVWTDYARDHLVQHFFLFGYAVVLEVFSVRNRMNSFFFNYFWFSSDRKLCFSSEHKMDQMIIL